MLSSENLHQLVVITLAVVLRRTGFPAWTAIIDERVTLPKRYSTKCCPDALDRMATLPGLDSRNTMAKCHALACARGSDMDWVGLWHGG